MPQESELHGWLEEALIAIERFQEASNVFLHRYKIGKFSKFAMFLLLRTTISFVSRRAACYETLCSRMGSKSSTTLVPPL